VNDNDRERETSEALLIFEVAVNRRKQVKLRRRQLQQFAIFTPAQSTSATVMTSWPRSSLRAARGSFSVALYRSE
jgi:hypothetical protein